MTHPQSQLLLSLVQRTLKQRQLLPKNQRLLIAVSGGQDSLCLAKLLLNLQHKWHWHLAIAHYDHRWTHDVGIADHVQTIAQAWQVPFYLKTAVEVSESEAIARKWRYQALIDIAQTYNYKYILTAHTKSDRAETLLYNLMRGSGSDGLSSLRWKRQLTPEIELVRPLLEITRTQTGEFCQEWQLPLWEDVYNQDLKYARSRIRQELIPYLKTNFNPQVENNLAQTAELLRADVEYLENQARDLLKTALNRSGEWRENEQKIPYPWLISEGINRRVLKEAPLALQRRVIRQFLQDILPSAPSFQHIEKIIVLITAPNHSQTDPLPGGFIAHVEGEWINLRF